MKQHYNKLIRDKIPEILEQSGFKYEIDYFSEADYLIALKEKLMEEATEWVNAPSEEWLSELADLYEVIDALMAIRNADLAKGQRAHIDQEEVKIKQQEKRERRGGFEKRIKLKWTEERKD